MIEIGKHSNEFFFFNIYGHVFMHRFVCVLMHMSAHWYRVDRNHKERAYQQAERTTCDFGTLTSLRFFIAWGNMPWCNCSLPTFIICTPLTGWFPG